MGGTQPAIAPFAHNHLHDLESWWWVVVWIIYFNQFCNLEKREETPSLEELSHQLMLTRQLFPLAPGLDSCLASLQASFQSAYLELPHSKHLLCFCLDALRRILLKHYVAIERTLPHSITLTESGYDIYDDFMELLVDIPNSELAFNLGSLICMHEKVRGLLKWPAGE
jgi:hypothetical protein